MKKNTLSNTTYTILIITVILFISINKCNANGFNLIKGNKLYKNGLYSDAFNKYKLEIIKHPNSEKALFNAANSLYKLEDYTNAINYYKKALIKSKGKKAKSMIYYNIGNSLYKLGKYEEALDEFYKALMLDPYNKKIKQNLELTANKLKNRKNNKGSTKNLSQSKKNIKKDEEKNQNQVKKQSKNEQSTTNPEQQKTNKALTEKDAIEILKSLEEKNQYQLQKIIKNKLNKDSNNENGW